MADENHNAEQKKPREGRMIIPSDPDTTWDAFVEGDELVAVTKPYEAPTFYHIGQREDGSWHVLQVEKYDHAPEHHAVLDAQLTRVQWMHRLEPDEDGVCGEIRAMNLYTSCESPEAKSRAEERWKRVQADVARELAEAKNSKPKKPQFPPYERHVQKHGGPKLVGGVFLTYTFDKDR